jgi:sugar (pentulose or hexulose) kinase
MAHGRPGGRVEGIGLGHRAEHLLRAAVEGLACELARHLRMMTDAGMPVSRLVMCGTAAASRVTPQIVADVTQRPVVCIRESAISAFGAAVIGRAMVEQGRGLGPMARRLAPASRTVEPGGDAAAYRDVLARYLEAFQTDGREE